MLLYLIFSIADYSQCNNKGLKKKGHGSGVGKTCALERWSRVKVVNSVARSSHIRESRITVASRVSLNSRLTIFTSDTVRDISEERKEKQTHFQSVFFGYFY